MKKIISIMSMIGVASMLAVAPLSAQDAAGTEASAPQSDTHMAKPAHKHHKAAKHAHHHHASHKKSRAEKTQG
jgi:ABC-type Zn2+ transport system substrate-binding protein/surface adhesin